MRTIKNRKSSVDGREHGAQAFSGCVNLTDVNFSDKATKLTVIPDRAFEECKSLENIKIIPSITTIDSCAFQLIENDDSTKRLNIDFSNASNLVTIGSSAFSCSRLVENFVVPKTVKEINSDAFQNTTGIETLSFEKDSAIETIESTCFAGSTVKKITIPAGLGSFDSGAFAYSSVEEIVFDKDNVITEFKNELFSNVNGLKKITFSENLEKFSGIFIRENSCNNITELVFPTNSKLTVIEKNAFSKFNKLSTVNLPNSLTTIAEYAFSSASLTEIVVPSSVTTIGKYAFAYNSKLVRLDIPSSVTSIGDCFVHGCSGLRELIIRTDKIVNVYLESVRSTTLTSLERIYVPAEKVETYKGMSGFENYKDKILSLDLLQA